jgi:predicted transcriptional regulator
MSNTRSYSALSIASKHAESREAAQGVTVSHDTLVAAASQIVSAYIVNRPQENMNLMALTAEVYSTLAALSRGEEVRVMPSALGNAQKRAPKIAVEESVKPDYLVCLEDGKRVKMLKRYLKTNFSMTPEEYRNRWSLPESYPMVAPNYAKVRSSLAKKIGLGRRGMPLAARRLSAAQNDAR